MPRALHAGIQPSTISLSDFNEQMSTKGWIIFPNFIGTELVDQLNEDLLKAWDICREIQIKNGVANDADLTVHHLLGLGDSFLTLIESYEPLTEFIESYFGGKFILNSIGGAINKKGHKSYAQRIHRDIRSFSGNIPLLLNTLVMLDEFTEENGATFLCTGSHLSDDKPSEEDFAIRAEQALAPAGSILLFNSNLWHAGGHNTTEFARRSITPMFCRPFIKPQFDYPRTLGYDRSNTLSAHVKQLAGYNSRIPASLNEWYQPPELRMYKPDQG